MSTVDELVAFVLRCVDEDELWAKAASADRDGKTTVPAGVHWTWAVGAQWEPVEADPLQPYMGGYDGQWSNPVVLRTVEEWPLDWGGPDNTLPVKIAESEELRTADGAHIALHDPARVLREVESKRALIKEIGNHAAKIDGEWGCCHSGPDILAGRCPEMKVHEITALRLLAAVYSDRPGYREEWKP
jgi:hypothetical protein